jgi:outer membrane protein assembly factor BamA
MGEPVIKRIIRNLIVLAALLCAAASRAADDVPRFLIERIEVRNLRHASPEIVIAESRLKEGVAYDERELAAASDRINRLPFILEAAFSLEKGSVRDSYVLAIAVSETKPFFYLFDAPAIIAGDRAVVDYNGQAAVGLRTFVGRRNGFHLGFTGATGSSRRSTGRDPAAIEAGYTRYDLFGTGAFATFNLKYSVFETAQTLSSGHLLPELIVGVPLSATQTVTAQYTTRDDSYRAPQSDQPDARLGDRIFRAKWSYNTTNQPFFPTRGVILSAGPELRWTDSSSYAFIATSTTPPFTYDFEHVLEHSNSKSVVVQAARYWEVSERNSLSALGEGEVAWERGRTTFRNTGRFSNTNEYGRIDLGFSHSFWSPERIAVDGEQRIEAHVQAFADRYDVPRSDRQFFVDHRVSGEQASVSWVRRNAWGAIRIGLGYAW